MSKGGKKFILKIYLHIIIFLNGICFMRKIFSHKMGNVYINIYLRGFVQYYYFRSNHLTFKVIK